MVVFHGDESHGDGTRKKKHIKQTKQKPIDLYR